MYTTGLEMKTSFGLKPLMGQQKRGVHKENLISKFLPRKFLKNQFVLATIITEFKTPTVTKSS